MAAGVRVAVEKVDVVLEDEDVRAVNRIGTRRGNRYVLHFDRIGAGAEIIVTLRINEQVKWNIQGKMLDAKCCGTTVVPRCRKCSQWGYSRAGRHAPRTRRPNIIRGL